MGKEDVSKQKQIERIQQTEPHLTSLMLSMWSGRKVENSCTTSATSDATYHLGTQNDMQCRERGQKREMWPSARAVGVRTERGLFWDAR